MTASATLNISWDRTWNWTIDKSVSGNEWNLFDGDQALSEYTVSVNKTGYIDDIAFSGIVTITNAGAVATENLSINVGLLMPPSSTYLTTVSVDTSMHPVLAPGETYAYSYSFYYAGIPSKNYKVSADITITNHSGHLGVPFGPSPDSSGVVFPSSPTNEVNASITVDDTYTNAGSPWSFTNSGSVSYNRLFTNESGIITNTAAIRETQQSDSANVTINRFSLDVSKSSYTSYIRTYDWAISKMGDQTLLNLAANQIYPVNYSVTVNNSYVDNSFSVDGTITIHNPAPIDAVINSIFDIVSPDVAANIDTTGMTFPFTLLAGDTIILTYNADLPNADNRTNTATAVLQNHLYTLTGMSPMGTTSYIGMANVIFGQPSSIIDEEVTVVDSLYGMLGTISANETPKTFTYMINVGPYTTPGTYYVDNTATLTTNDTGTTKSSSWRVTIILQSQGYTLTIGYWKNYAGFGPQNDMVSPLLSIWLGNPGGSASVLISNTTDAVRYLSMNSDASNGINKLYAQLLAAKLNIKNGADDSSVKTIITLADNFLSTYNDSSWSTLSKTQKTLVLSWASTLDQYNNGLIGPGHATI